MIEILKFVFQSFWHFAGSIILISVILNGLAGIVANLSGLNVIKIDDENEIENNETK